MQTIVVWCLFLISPMLIMSEETRFLVEVCDNGVDDDGDGQIDLNDSDCGCPLATPVSLIPNPSFEESECCPTTRSQLHCATTWIQASQATTDYLHSCGWFGWENLPVPQPIPDGDACIGYRDGRAGNMPNPNWKEYTGACLTHPLRAGTSYKFRFNIGFTFAENSPPTSVVFYGSTSCDFLPFGGGDDRHGCPLNGPGWVQMGLTRVAGINSWATTEINVIPKEDIYAIAIGPDCVERMRGVNLYYFLDNLVLADQKEFLFTIQPDSNSCASDFMLQVPSFDTLEYQWYLNKIALVGETNSVLKVKTGDGLYQVLITGPSSCKLTNPFLLSIPVIQTVITDHLCEEAVYPFAGKEIVESGTYFDTLHTKEGCDSIIQLNLLRAPTDQLSQQAKIFDGESYQVGNFSFSQPTSETVTLTSSFGCDSIVDLSLDFYEVYMPTAFSPNGDGVNDQLAIFSTDELVTIVRIQIFSRWGRLLFEAENISAKSQMLWDGIDSGQMADSGLYLYKTQLLMDDGLEHTLSGSFMLLK